MALLIVFAHPMEAAPTIDLLGHEFEKGRIAITGMGRWEYDPTGASEIWNFGLAGSLRDDLEVGKIYPIATATDGQQIVKIQDEGKQLFTSATPVWDLNRRQELGKTCDLVDMEGFGIAKRAPVPCKLWKIVSDYAKPGQQADLKKRLTPLAEALALQIQQLISLRN